MFSEQYTAVEESCVKDTNTRLYWEIKSTDPLNFRFNGHLFSWYQPEHPAIFAGESAQASESCLLSQCDTNTYITAVNEQKLCGFDDWRLPSVHELSAITHFGRVNPALGDSFEEDYFGPRFWTNTYHSTITQLAWYVYFTDGSVSYTPKITGSHVRLVRGDSTNHAQCNSDSERFVYSGESI